MKIQDFFGGRGSIGIAGFPIENEINFIERNKVSGWLDLQRFHDHFGMAQTIEITGHFKNGKLHHDSSSALRVIYKDDFSGAVRSKDWAWAKDGNILAVIDSSTSSFWGATVFDRPRPESEYDAHRKGLHYERRYDHYGRYVPMADFPATLTNLGFSGWTPPKTFSPDEPTRELAALVLKTGLGQLIA